VLTKLKKNSSTQKKKTIKKSMIIRKTIKEITEVTEIEEIIKIRIRIRIKKKGID